MTHESNFSIPNPEKLSSVKELCEIENPYLNFQQSDKLFIKSMKEIVEWHMQKSPFYKKLVDSENFQLSQIKTIDDLILIPHLWAHFFKSHEVLSVSRENIFLHLTSSGTTGQKSQIFFDEWTIKSAQRMIDWIFNYYGWNTPNIKANYILFSYETEASSKLGTAYTDNFLCKYAPVGKVFHALRLNGNGGHEFDCFGTIEKFIEFAKEGIPVRLFGFPAFFYFALERMKKLKIYPVKLHPDSMVFLGGGWKGNSEKQIEKNDLYKLANEMLGLKNERLRDGFGSVEHCIPYVECMNHEFHIPVYSRVFIRDIKNLKNVGFNKPGFLHFVSPYITSVPAHSVIMGDLASLHEPHTCSCGLNTPYFKILGRAGLSKNKSCAVAASELLKGKS
jgi:phenylacetate-coenzyme A ligase PaaK-like adenylate-forming protein